MKNESYIEEKLKENEKLIKAVIKKEFREYTSKNNQNFEELYQEGLIAVWNAIQRYDENYNVEFSTYAWSCIRNSLIKFISKQNKYQEKMQLVEFGYEANQKDFERYNRGYDNINEWLNRQDILDKINCLKKNEKLILTLKTQGFNYKEISKILEMEHSGVRVMAHRSRKKLKEMKKHE